MRKGETFSPKEVAFFQDIIRTLIHAQDSSHLLDLILDISIKEFKAERASVFLRDEETGVLRLLAARGIPTDIVKQKPVIQEKSISYWVAKNKTPLILDGRIRKDPRFKSYVKRTINSALIAPMIYNNRTIGVISISRIKTKKTFSPKQLTILTMMAGLSAVSINIARLQEKRIHMERLATIGLVTAEIAHSIKNILTSFDGAVRLMESALKRNDWVTLNEAWGILNENLERISRFIFEMLDYTRARVVIGEKVEIGSLVEDIVAIIREKAASRKIEIKVFPPEKPVAVPADREALNKVLLNLAGNAIDAMPGGGTLSFRWEKDLASPYVNIQIEDTGFGIPKRNLKKLFEPFFSTKGAKGTGLGLPIAKKIIEEHSGWINVSSTVGKGTTFTIRLPLEKERKTL
jgi:signal transduction histidine kinase